MDAALKIQFKKLHPAAVVPKRATKDSAGFDLVATEDVTVFGGLGNVMVPTGLAIQMPPGHCGIIMMRSGLAVREHLAVSAGCIDRDYLSELKVIVFRTEPQSSYTIRAGERFAQILIKKISYADSIEVEEFADSASESHAGFGSTGKF